MQNKIERKWIAIIGVNYNGKSIYNELLLATKLRKFNCLNDKLSLFM